MYMPRLLAKMSNNSIDWCVCVCVCVRILSFMCAYCMCNARASKESHIRMLVCEKLSMLVTGYVVRA
jgi:hypothetical protein